MRTYEVTPTQFSVGDFLTWQRQRQLNLSPAFQRRSVWKPDAKSYLVDSVVRGLPIPLIFLRERIDLSKKVTVRDVVDGQQRLRTLFSYIEPRLLPDFDPERDSFRVRAAHNPVLANKAFDELAEEHRLRILGYKLSVQILPTDITDRDVLEIFARLNSTGQRLNHQELRNAAYFGEFKTAMYQMAYDQFERWLRWSILTPDQLTRMLEVEVTSDLVVNMIKGLSGKSQVRINNAYKDYDKSFEDADVVKSRFGAVMDCIDDQLGDMMRRSVFASEVHFFTLFVYVYDVMYGLGSRLNNRPPREVSSSFRRGATEVSRRFKEWEVPANVIDAVSRASADFGRRETRLDFMKQVMRKAERRAETDQLTAGSPG
jgi:hypothetical protein